jgi:hypothetical protein
MAVILSELGAQSAASVTFPPIATSAAYTNRKGPMAVGRGTAAGWGLVSDSPLPRVKSASKRLRECKNNILLELRARMDDHFHFAPYPATCRRL